MENLHNPSRRLVVGGGALALMLAGSGLSSHRAAFAQDATPAPLEFPLGPGVTAEIVEPPDGNPALFRAQIEAGVSWEASDGTDPSIALVYGESGTVMVQTNAAVTVFRAAAAGKPGEPIAASTEFEIGPGDFLAAPGLTPVTIRNDGATPAALLIASIYPSV